MTETRYETDFYGWLQVQAAHLRAKEWSGMDIDNLAEELDTLGRSERNAMWNHLRVLLLHLLKWAYQPERRGRSWRRSILLARQHLARRLRDNPSLRPELLAFVVEAYADARPTGRGGSRPASSDVSRDLSLDAGPTPGRGLSSRGVDRMRVMLIALVLLPGFFRSRLEFQGFFVGASSRCYDGMLRLTS